MIIKSLFFSAADAKGAFTKLPIVNNTIKYTDRYLTTFFTIPSLSNDITHFGYITNIKKYIILVILQILCI